MNQRDAQKFLADHVVLVHVGDRPATKAQQVVDACGTRCEKAALAATFEGGYGMSHDGKRIEFPQPVKKLGERRNRNGRVLMARYEYDDGSFLRFTWSDDTGSRLMAEKHR